MKYIKGPPTLDMLILEKLDMRKKIQKTAIIIPTVNRKKTLEEHLRYLEMQQNSNFDLIIVYGKDDQFLKKNALHIKEKESNGSAGGFFLGERIALDEGYENIILADDDCFPVSLDLINKMIDGLKANAVVLPKISYADQYFNYEILHHYGGFRREVFENAGLTYLPLGFGGEDLELKNRIEKKFQISLIDAIVEHKTDVPMIIEEERLASCYARGGFLSSLLNDQYVRAYFGALFHIVAAWIFLIVGRKELAKALFFGIFDGAFLQVENRAFKIEDRHNENIDVDIIIESKNMSICARNSSILQYVVIISSWTNKILEIVFNIPKYLNKKILFKENYDPVFMFLMVLSKQSYFQFNNELYRIDVDKHIFWNIFGFLIAFAGFLPIAMITFFLLFIAIFNKFLLGINTHGYGISKVI